MPDSAAVISPHARPGGDRDGMLIWSIDERMKLRECETVKTAVRFRTLGLLPSDRRHKSRNPVTLEANLSEHAEGELRSAGAVLIDSRRSRLERRRRKRAYFWMPDSSRSDSAWRCRYLNAQGITRCFCAH